MVPLGPAAAVCVLLAAPSLALPSALGYDPYAWVVWGRELAHLDLSTTGGPSFKPLPVLVTALLSPLGDLTPDAWALIVRAAGLLGVVFAFRVAARFAGVAGGATAALAAALAASQARNGLQGYSEPLLICLALGAVDMHLSGRTRWAFALGALGALVRPELWALLALYGALHVAADAAFRPALVGALVPCRPSGSGWTGGAPASCSTAAAWPAARRRRARPSPTARRSRCCGARPSWSRRRCWRPPWRRRLALRRRAGVVVVLGAGHGPVGGCRGRDGRARLHGQHPLPGGAGRPPGGARRHRGGLARGGGRPRTCSRAGGRRALALLVLGFAFSPARSSVRWLSVAREQHEQLDELDAGRGPGGRSRRRSGSRAPGHQPVDPDGARVAPRRAARRGCRPPGAPRPPSALDPARARVPGARAIRRAAAEPERAPARAPSTRAWADGRCLLAPATGRSARVERLA